MSEANRIAEKLNQRRRAAIEEAAQTAALEAMQAISIEVRMFDYRSNANITRGEARAVSARIVELLNVLASVEDDLPAGDSAEAAQ